MTTRAISPKERAIAFGAMSLVGHCAIAGVSTEATLTTIGIGAITISAGMAVMGYFTTCSRIVRAIVVGPIAGLLIASHAVPDILGHIGTIDTRAFLIDLGETILWCAVFAPLAELADPAARVRRWATGERSRWLAYYAVHFVQFVLLLSSALSVGAGLLNLIIPVDWLSIEGVPRGATSVAAFMAGGGLFAVLTLLNGGARPAVSRLHKMFRRSATPGEKIGSVEEGERNGLPWLSWSQETASEETVASTASKFLWKTWIWVVVFGGALGLASGSLENAVFGALVAGWIGSLGLRGAGTLAFEGGALRHVPHVKTDADRHEEITPMRRREDCEAFLEVSGDKIYFCVARGDKSMGPLPEVERVPWDSFGNFEEGSHKQWFRSRGVVDERLDWDVIIAQSNVGRVVHVAESLSDHAWLVELLVKLQNAFIVPRDAMLKEFRDAVAAKSGGSQPVSTGGQAVQAVPVKPF